MGKIAAGRSLSLASWDQWNFDIAILTPPLNVVVQDVQVAQKLMQVRTLEYRYLKISVKDSKALRGMSGHGYQR